MESILVEQTEKTVKRAADSMMPPMIRDRIKESLENTLPREVQSKVDKATSDKMGEIVEAMVNVLQTEAKKTVPLVAKEKLPEIAERQVTAACEQRIPQLVQAEARGAVGNELNLRIKPLVEAEGRKIKNQAGMWVAIMGLVVLISIVANIYFVYQQNAGQ